MTAVRRKTQYFILANGADPYLLARVCWPDISQAISPGRPDWQDDPGLFDLPYSPASTAISYDEAARLISEWGAQLPSPDEGPVRGPALIRRMPSNWSDLSRAERRAWAIDLPRRVKAAAHSESRASIAERRRPEPAMGPPTELAAGADEPISPDGPANESRDFDLEPRAVALAAVDHA